MSDMAKGTIVGVFIAVILAGFIVAVLDYWPRAKAPDRDRPTKVTVARIGPDGKSGTVFGDDVKNAIVRGSQRYDVCFGEMRVQRPPMMTSDMPTSYCTVTRKARKGAWRISTGGWQECQAVCVRFGKP